MRDIDYSVATEFLARFYEGTEHAVEIRALPNDHGQGPSRPIFTRDGDLVQAHCERWDAPDRAVYFGVATRITGSPTGARADLAELPALWIDIDSAKHGLDKGEIVAVLRTMPLPPSVIIDSGNGIHGYWLLREALDVRQGADDLEDSIVAALKQLAGALCGDTAVCDLARIMRLPGTHNTKRGGMAPAHVIEATWVRHEFDDIVDMLDWLRPLIRRPAAASEEPPETNPFLEAAKRFAFKPAIDVQQRLDAMVYEADGPHGINATQRDVSASLVSRGADDDEIVGLLLAATHRAAWPYGERWNWKREEKKIRGLITEWRKKLARADRPTAATVVQLRGGGAQEAPKGDAEAVAPDNAPELLGHPLNDIGNAMRLLLQHGAALRYVVGIGWHVWDGRRYEFDPATVGARRFAHDTARDMLGKAFDMPARDKEQSERRKNIIKFCISSGNTNKVSGMLSQAEPYLAVVGDALDRDPWLLNCLNGTLDLRSGSLRPHSQDDLLTKLVPVDYDRTAQCPVWERVIAEIFGGDAEMVDYVQRALGYSLTGLTTEQVVFILHGSGSNGKSLLLEIVAAVLADYAEQSPSTTFVENHKGSGINNDVARLVGSRFVSVVETEQDQKLAEGLVKQATGGDRMTARFLRQEFFEFVPQFKMWMATNHKPRVRGTDNAIWRRIRLLPFLVTFADAESAVAGQMVRDQNLKDKLMKELPGILKWMVDGCTKWQKSGLTKAPPAVTSATTDYRESQDITSGFLSECCHQSPGLQSAVGALYKAYRNWCIESGETPASSTVLGLALEEKGFASFKGAHGRRMRKGLDLKADCDAAEE